LREVRPRRRMPWPANAALLVVPHERRLSQANQSDGGMRAPRATAIRTDGRDASLIGLAPSEVGRTG